MSENIPESIPTSADPRSKRPLKKRALSPRSQTASHLEALFSKPDQEIKIPPSASSSTALSRSQQLATAPEIVANVQGSSAGAGSGEFHVYKASRRREYERLRAMDEEVKEEEEKTQWEKEKEEREEKDRERTRKNKEKRDKLKKRKAGKGANGKSEEKVGGVKARMDVKRDEEVVNGNEKQDGEVVEAQPQGLVIHDDD